MTTRKRKYIALLTILLSPIAIASFYVLVHGISFKQNMVSIISFFVFYIFAVPIGILIVLKYYGNDE